MESTPREIIEYVTESGKCPFEDWINDLKDIQARALIRKRLTRIRLGNFGNVRTIGDGVMELKIDFGPGYRVYYALDGETLVVLLCGGDKGSQERDILKAKEYWKDYRS